MKTTASLYLSLLLPFTAFAAEKPPLSAEKLIALTIKSPGDYGQTCNPAPRVDPKIPLPLFEAAMSREVTLSQPRIAALRARRGEVVPALKTLLASIDPAKPAPNAGPFVMNPPDGETGEVLSSGISPQQISGLLLGIVAELEAVEALPELLALEERLRAALERADSDPKTPTPSVADDGYFFIKGKPEVAPREKDMARGRIVQREMLSLMLQLLRHQRFQPMLDSEFEKAYAKSIVAQAKADPERGRNGQKPWVDFDPIHKVRLGYYTENPPSVPFSREVREKVRGLANDFLKTVPPEKWNSKPL